MTVIDDLLAAIPQLAAQLAARPAVVIPPITTEQKTTIADVLQSIADTLRNDSSLPIINKIEQIKTKIQNNSEILDVTKTELQTELDSLEKQITRLVENLINNYLFNNYGFTYIFTGLLLQQQLQQLTTLQQLLQQQLQQLTTLQQLLLLPQLLQQLQGRIERFFASN